MKVNGLHEFRALQIQVFVVKCKKRFDIVLMGIEARWEIIEYYMMK